jgi:hypothetical protein
MARRVPGSGQRARRPGIRTSDLRRRNRLSTKLTTSIKDRINLAARQAAAAIMNDLAEKGPAYSGNFRDSWRAIAVRGAINEPQPSGYPYSTRDVPRLNTNYKTMELTTIFRIENEAPYALQAMDISPGVWRKPEGVKPEGGIEFGIQYGDTRARGGSNGTFRWDISLGESDEDRVLITAEADWYTKYVMDGSMSAEFKRVVRLAFKRGR